MNVPALRFKDDDGQDFPEWKTDSLGSLFTIKAGGDVARENVSETKNEVFKYPIFANSDKNFGLYGFSDTYKIDVEAITVTGRGNLGVAVPRYEPFYPIVRLLSLIPKSKFNVYFGATQINNINFHSESTGVPQLTAPQLANYELTYPAAVEEQTKIASFLKAVDEKITQLTQKHDLLTQYKKGVMQQIFSQELRFKYDDGRDFPEWEEKELKTICDLITKGTTPTSVGHEFKISGINFIKIESLEDNGKLIKEKLGFIDSDAHAKLLRSQLKLNDLLFSIAGALGRVAIVTDEFLPANTNQALAIIRLSKSITVDTKFVFYTLSNEGIKKLIESISA